MSRSNNYTVEQFYLAIKPEINLLSGYLEDKEIANVIIQCRLKPYLYNGMFNRTALLRRQWVDEFGNSLYIEKKRYKIIINDLSIDKSKVRCTDLYEGLPISDLVKISTLAHLSVCREEDDYQIISLKGIDNYLRTFVIMDKVVYRVSSLLLGIKNIKKIIKNEDIKLWKQFKKEGDMIFPCSKIDSWLVSLPIRSQFWDESKLDKQQFNYLENI